MQAGALPNSGTQATGYDGRSGLLVPEERRVAGSRMHRLSQAPVLLEKVTGGAEFKNGMACSQKSEYSSLIGHHEPPFAGMGLGEEPEESMSSSQYVIYTLVTHWLFEAIAAGVIVCNAFVMGVAAEVAIRHNADNPSDKSGATNGFVEATGYIFFAFYFVELLLRLFAFRLIFFTGGEKIWNWLDLILVISAIYDIIEKAAGPGYSGSNFSFFRLLRLLKMMKMLRVFRVMKFFRELRVMMYAIVGSMRLLFWAMVMLSLITYMFSLVFLQGVNQYLTSNDVDSEVRTEALLYWGSVGNSMVTLYEAITGGNDWSPLAAPLKHCGEVYYYLFLFYVAFLSFTVLNVLTGVVVDAAMMITQLDGDNVTDEFMCNQLADGEKLNELIDSIELNGDGTLQWDELLSSKENERIRDFFENTDIDISEVEGFYRLLQCQGNDDRVNTKAFLKGCANLKLWGASKSIESFLLMKDIRRLRKVMDANCNKLLACFAKQGVDMPEEEDADDSGDELFDLPEEFAEPGRVSGAGLSRPWTQLVDECTDVTLLNSISSRVAERVEMLAKTKSRKPPGPKGKAQVKQKNASPAGPRTAGTDGVDVSQESVSKLADLIVKEAMPQLLQEVEKILRTESSGGSTPEPKLYGAPSADDSYASSPQETKDVEDEGPIQQARSKKKFHKKDRSASKVDLSQPMSCENTSVKTIS